MSGNSPLKKKRLSSRATKYDLAMLRSPLSKVSETSMATDKDKLLVEATKTHRARLNAAYVFGNFDERRKVQTNRGRFIASFVIAAIACVGCFGTAFVINLLTEQKEQKAIEAFRKATQANPMKPDENYKKDPSGEYLINKHTGRVIDPKTGFTVDPETGIATDEQGRKIDTRTHWFINVETGNYTDPKTGVTINPDTLEVVEGAQQ